MRCFFVFSKNIIDLFKTWQYIVHQIKLLILVLVLYRSMTTNKQAKLAYSNTTQIGYI